MAGFELESAVEKYGRELFARAYALLCDWHEAEDAVQDAFVAAYEHRARLGGNERAWLYRVLTNKCLDRLRRRTSVSLRRWATLRRESRTATTPDTRRR